jgi:AraC family transcriptional regulator of adaptative response / DNA-3-methyladenine glycosylase II
MRLIADGVVDRDGVTGLAQRLGYTERHVHRQLVSVVGVGPLALARAQRAQTARILLETTTVAVTEIAFASGFQSVRQFNATIREIFALTPRELRVRAHRPGHGHDSDAIVLRLPYRSPLDAEGLIAYFAQRAVAGVEEVLDGAYRRSLRLPRAAGVVELVPADGYVQARFWLEDLRDLAAAVQRCRGLLDLDSDPQAVVEALGPDALLGPLVRSAPGRRVAGHVDGDELAIRAVLGQQISLASAATHAARLVAAYGTPLVRPLGAVTHVFASAPALAAADPGSMAMPRSRRQALLGLARALSDGELVLDPGADRERTARRLLALPGIGPWTTSYIAMRALRDPDAYMPSDLGVLHALEQLGEQSTPAAAAKLGERWRPYRAYALQYLWAFLAQSQAAAVERRVALAA